MGVFAHALSYMAGYGLKAYLITQDIRQIVDAYGPNESIVSNCHVRVAFTPNQYETAELLSKMGSAREFVEASISCRFLESDKFRPGHGHPLSLQKEVAEVLVTS